MSNQRLCFLCVDEPFLRAEIQEAGVEDVCSYCGTKTATISLDEMANFVGTALSEHFNLTDATNPFPDEPWSRSGSAIVEVISSAAEIDEPIADEIRQILASRHEDTGVDDEALPERPFDASAHYSKRAQVDDWDFHSDWYDFERTLKTKARYFNWKAEQVLRAIFERIHEQNTADGHPVVVDAGPGTGLAAFYRARGFQSVHKLREALKRPDKEIGPPPPAAAVAGRMNARGISVFYGATDSETALAEVRPPVGGQVLVGRFDVIRLLKLLDLKALESVNIADGSIFDSDHTRRLKRARFLAWLSGRMTMPVMPDDEPDDYLATQAISDFLASTLDPPLDGIIYPSVQVDRPLFRFRSGIAVREQNLNIVLFHTAARVRPLSIGDGADISVRDDSLYGSFDIENLEKGPGARYSVWENVPNAVPSSAEPDFYDDGSGPGDYDLQLDVSSLRVHYVSGVRLTTKASQVFRYRSSKQETATEA
jgi:RES domain/HEPN/RES N-terminal domain 1